jgi:NAD-dependent dihydropyrimidine dehydrogenase PreA subunit
MDRESQPPGTHDAGRAIHDHQTGDVSLLEDERETFSRASTVPVSSPRVKKIPPELRKQTINFSQELKWHRRLLLRLQEDSQFLRTTVQAAFALLCIWIGIEFYLFMQWGQSGGAAAYIERPPGVEGFLPIGALMSIRYWILTGIINEIHPAAIFIFLAIVGTSLVLKKSFCSWLCPIGTLSESLWMLGKKLFGKNPNIPWWLDYPLRSLKYLILFYFVYSIWTMDVAALRHFIYSPYYKVADIKMYLFFANITSFALWTIVILMVLSVVVKNFWCRYLCPYGALLGVFSFFSPLKITRNAETCIDCKLCTKACPANIKVHKVGRVWSDECMSCMMCVEACPVKNTLEMRTRHAARPISSWVFGVLIAGVFMGITGLAMLTGHWQNEISQAEYLKRFQELDSPLYQHFRGEVPDYGPND